MTAEELRAAQIREAGYKQNFGGNTPLGSGFEVRSSLLGSPKVLGFNGVKQDSATGHVVRNLQSVSTNSYYVKIQNTYNEMKRIALFDGNLPKELIPYNSEQKGVDAIAKEGKFLITDEGLPTEKYLKLSGKFNFDKYVATLKSGYCILADRLKITPSVMSALDVTFHIEYNRLFDTNEKLSFQPNDFLDRNQNQDFAEIPLAIGDDAVCFSPMTTMALEIAPNSTLTILMFANITHSNLDATLALARALPQPAM